jgi:hypothetical protein
MEAVVLSDTTVDHQFFGHRNHVWDPFLADRLLSGPFLVDPWPSDPFLADRLSSDPFLWGPFLGDPLLSGPFLADPWPSDPFLADPWPSDRRILVDVGRLVVGNKTTESVVHHQSRA